MAGDTVAPPRWYSHRLNRLVYYRIAGAAAGLLPRRSRLRVARLAGRIAARGLTEERTRVRGNLARILPGAGPRALERAVGETFANFAACFSDLLTINRGAPERLGAFMVDRRGEEHLDAACVAGRGVILLTAHLGNWELGGRLLVPRVNRPTHIVLAGEQDTDLERYLRRAGERLRFVTRRHATSTLGLVAALRRNEAVAMQGDRPTGERDVLVEFFGAPAAFPVGPFVLARATGAPVVPAYCAMKTDQRYEMVVEPAIWVKPGEEAGALAAMVTTLERAVRAHPTQWFNFFDVWSPPRVAA
jgi:KDO2-lipid IV(A) lauroyltransferase